MNGLLLDCKVVLGLAQSMAEREGYDTSVYDNCIEKINEALRIPAVVEQSEQLPTDIEIGKMVNDLAKIADDETEKDFDLIECPNCGSEAVGYDGSVNVLFLECFQCDHNWIP